MSIELENIKAYIDEAEEYYSNVEEYYKSLSFKEAVRNAAQAIVPSNIKSCTKGKTSFAGHQRRVGKQKCKEGAEMLLTHPYWIELEKAKSFEEIFNVTEKVKHKIYRLGDLWSYDTAQRIALHKGWYPKEVYLQSGAFDGAKILAELRYMDGMILKGKRSVSNKSLPNFLSKLDPYLIENILCIGKRENWFK